MRGKLPCSLCVLPVSERARPVRLPAHQATKLLDRMRLAARAHHFGRHQILVRSGKGGQDRTGQLRRYHLHPTVLQRAIKQAVRRAASPNEPAATPSGPARVRPG